MKRTLLILLSLACLTALAAWMSSASQLAAAQTQPAPNATQEPTASGMFPTPNDARLAAWPTVYPPTQADDGAQVYWARCMMCHGDKGQGLNQDWLSVMDPPDRNCWKSGCHGSHHPSFGFSFPKVVPGVIGEGVLDNFSTGLDVYHFIKLYMPYQEPGGLDDKAYWDLTAYILRENGLYSGKEPLDAARAEAIQVRPASAAPPQVPEGPSWQPWAPYIAVGAVLAVFFGGIGVSRMRKR